MRGLLPFGILNENPDNRRGGKNNRMLDTIFIVNLAVFLIFLIFYSYQMVYLYIGWQDKKKESPAHQAKMQYRFGIVIAARNESVVIGALIDSISKQTYPQELIEVYVVADNCKDDTARIARQQGANVFDRSNEELIGKGYALDFVFKEILSDPTRDLDAFIILDADNLLNESYVEEINSLYDQGYRACTSYRNTKNYAQNWISAGYGLWFLREAEYLNRPRFVLGNSCAISGTGFMLAYELIENFGGWPFHTLTEDIEFSVDSVLAGETIGYAGQAMLYDEQPATFSQSWDQRLRWAKGFYQVLGKYFRQMLQGVVRHGDHHRFSLYDMMMTVTPALFVTLACVLFNLLFLIYGACFAPLALQDSVIRATLQALGMTLLLFYLTLFIVGAITTYSEWEKILAPNTRKIAACFSFPLFMFTYIPIAVTAIFKDVSWRPIHHSVSKSIDELEEANERSQL